MCQFFSAILLKNGDLIWSPFTDSHSVLESANNVRDNSIDNMAKLEFYPPEPKMLADVDSYTLRIDEERRPAWLTNAKEEKARDKMRSIALRMIIKDERSTVLGGCWILADSARVKSLHSARVIAMMGSSQVGEMRESSQVGEMWESSQVGEMRESSRVGEMLGSSQVGDMRGSSRVGVMWGSSQVGEMLESSQVGVMLGSSLVGVMLGSSQVGEMRESSQVGVMFESSRVIKDYRAKNA